MIINLVMMGEPRKLQPMAKAGTSAKDAIRTGTGDAARALGIAGELTEGAPAIGIALKKNLASPPNRGELFRHNSIKLLHVRE